MSRLTSELAVRMVDGISRPAGAATRSLHGVSNASRNLNTAAVGVAGRVRHIAAELAPALRMIGAVAAPYAIGRYLTSATKRYAALESELTELGITADVSTGQIKRAQRELERVAPRLGYTGGQIVDVTKALAAAGMEYNQAIASTPAVAKTAKATGAALNDVAQSANAVMSQLHVPVKELEKAFDAMAAGGKAGQFELKDMSREFPALTASAEKLGYSGVDGVIKLVAQLQIARKSAGTGAEAANNLRNSFEKALSAETRRNFKKFGVDIIRVFDQAAQRGENGFEAMLDAIENLTKGLSDAQRAARISELFPDQQARAGITAMLRYRGELREVEAQVRRSAGTIDKDLARRLDTTTGAWDRMTASIDRLTTRLGEGIAPAVKQAADSLFEVMDQIEQRHGGLLEKLGRAIPSVGGDGPHGPPAPALADGWIRGQRWNEQIKDLLLGKDLIRRTEDARRAALKGLYAARQKETGLPLEALVGRGADALNARVAELRRLRKEDLAKLDAAIAANIRDFGEDHPAVAGLKVQRKALQERIEALAAHIRELADTIVVVDNAARRAAERAQAAGKVPLPRPRPVPVPRQKPAAAPPAPKPQDVGALLDDIRAKVREVPPKPVELPASALPRPRTQDVKKLVDDLRAKVQAAVRDADLTVAGSR